MAAFREIKPEEIGANPFRLVGSDWLLITAANAGKVNTMTASWGGFGVFWGKNAAAVVIRPTRYTKEFVDAAGRFSLCVPGDAYRKELQYPGAVSGRDEDKIAKANLTILYEDGVPYFAESGLVLFCRSLYAQEMKADCFLDESLIGRWYPKLDFHTLYVGEIEKVLTK